MFFLQSRKIYGSLLRYYLNIPMTKLLKKICLLSLMMLNISVVVAKGPWLTNLEEGVKKAKADGKLVMVEFTGSDWCPPCKMMDEKVFSQEEFLKKAQEGYVLVKLDAPNSDAELKKSTHAVMEKWKVEGFPTILLLNAEGKEVTRFIATKYPTVEKFTEALVKEEKRKDML